jgi:hypothetical protein
LGSNEAVWKDAGFAFFEEANGTKNDVGGGVTGSLILFRTGYKDGVLVSTTEFSERAPVKLSKEAQATPAGSWAVTAK